MYSSVVLRFVGSAFSVPVFSVDPNYAKKRAVSQRHRYIAFVWRLCVICWRFSLVAGLAA